VVSVAVVISELSPPFLPLPSETIAMIKNTSNTTAAPIAGQNQIGKEEVLFAAGAALAARGAGACRGGGDIVSAR
jgi:hypothetical protein